MSIVPTDDELAAQVRQLAEQLLAQRQQLVSAESCTGGWIAKVATDLAGSSAWFGAGVVSYSNAAKQRLLGVPAETLASHGAVSGPTALAMVEGVLTRLDGDVAVAVTGIAGPGGGSAEKPVGTVWIAWQRRGQPPRAQRFLFAGDREAVRRQTVAAALSGVQQALTA